MALNINIHTPSGLVPISSGSSSDVTYQQIIDILGYTPLDVNNYVTYTFAGTTKYLDVSSKIVNNTNNVSVNVITQTLEDAIFTGNDTGLATAHNVATELANTELALAQSINSIKDSVGLKNNLTIDWQGSFNENTTIVEAIKDIKNNNGNSNTNNNTNTNTNSADLSEYLNKTTGGTILGATTFNSNVLFNNGELGFYVTSSTLCNTDVQKLSVYSSNDATAIDTDYVNATKSILTTEIRVQQHRINNTPYNNEIGEEYNKITFYDSISDAFSNIAVGNVQTAGIYLNEYNGTNNEYVITADGGTLSVTTDEADIHESSYSLVNGQTLYNYVKPFAYTQMYYNAYIDNITPQGQPILIYQRDAFIKGVPAGKYRLTANIETTSENPTFVALRHNGQFRYDGASVDDNGDIVNAIINGAEDILTTIPLDQDFVIYETFDIVIAYNCSQDVINDIITSGSKANTPFIADNEFTTDIQDLTLIAYSLKSYPDYLAIGINEKLNNKLNITGGAITGNITLKKDNIGIIPFATGCNLGNQIYNQHWDELHVNNAVVYNALSVKGNSNITGDVSANNIYANNTISAAGFYETSDIRKKNVVAKDISVNRCYDVIEKCSTILYTLKDDNSNKQQIGLIAQEIEEFFPEIIQTDQDGYKSIDYGRLVVVCMRVLKDMIDQKK